MKKNHKILALITAALLVSAAGVATATTTMIVRNISDRTVTAQIMHKTTPVTIAPGQMHTFHGINRPGRYTVKAGNEYVSAEGGSTLYYCREYPKPVPPGGTTGLHYLLVPKWELFDCQDLTRHRSEKG